ncbi:MAG: hypothetical protein P1V97_15460 [Planctomycetota bacterium]|nr:hypothetical protein [Planctomycetota bacterium]
MAQLYSYVGPSAIRKRVLGKEEGSRIRSRSDLEHWLKITLQEADSQKQIWVTFVVDQEGHLRVADRHSEHVQCAAGKVVLSAGELCFDYPSLEIAECSNQSTGYCPEPTSFPALKTAIEKSGLAFASPSCFTHEVIFRRCPSCRANNIVKDTWFECALCDAELPKQWNYH